MDGNIGIGGDPATLLERIRALLRPRTGELVVETEPEDVHETLVVTFDVAGSGTVGPAGPAPFGWTRIGTEALAEVARAVGFDVTERWSAGGRRFVALACPG
jgi:hypothetical protein